MVVFCHDAPEGWEIISITEPTEGIDLVFGAPAPIGVPTKKLSISTNKFEYAEEEVVTFWIENICNETVNLMNGAPWRIQEKTDGDWENVFVPMGIQVIIPIAPGENKSWSWSQRGQYGNYTGSEMYRVMLEYEGGEVETEFEICKATKLRYIDIMLCPKGSDSALYILDLGIVRTVKCHLYCSAESNASFYQNIETSEFVVDEAKKTGEYKPFPREEEKIEGGETSEHFISNTVSSPMQTWYIAYNNCSVPIHIYGTVETRTDSDSINQSTVTATATATATESLKAGLHFAMSEPNKWRDPHGLIIVGCMKPFIVEHFGAETYQDWLLNVSNAICFSNDSFGIGVDALDYPDYPEDPTCLGYPDGHETAVAIFGMNEAELTELNGHSLNELTNWLKYYPDNDLYSIGIRIQALLYGGVSLNETWQTADNRSVSLKSLMDDAIEEWREEKELENLSPGDTPTDLLLHLAPSLIVFKQKYPTEFIE